MSLALRFPLAMDIALALVAAAAAHDELWLLRRNPAGFLRGDRDGRLQAKWYVLAAITTAFPDLNPYQVAPWLGLPTDKLLRTELGKRQRLSAWDHELERRLFVLVAP